MVNIAYLVSNGSHPYSRKAETRMDRHPPPPSHTDCSPWYPSITQTAPHCLLYYTDCSPLPPCLPVSQTAPNAFFSHRLLLWYSISLTQTAPLNSLCYTGCSPMLPLSDRSLYPSLSNQLLQWLLIALSQIAPLCLPLLHRLLPHYPSVTQAVPPCPLCYTDFS